MCKKQTSVSHSSTESEIISLDTGLRLDGLLVLELWDLIVSVFGNISHVSDRTGQPDSDVHKHHKWGNCHMSSQEILKIQNPLLEEHCAFLKAYICSKKLDVQEQTAVSHSLTESEIILWTLD